MVDRTISLLISQLEENNQAKQIEIDSELIIRSSAKLPIKNFKKGVSQ